MMRGYEPRVLSDVLVSSGDPLDHHGVPLDYSDEERMLTSAVSVGELTACPPESNSPNGSTEIVVVSLIPWLRRRGYIDLAKGLSLPTLNPEITAQMSAQKQTLSEKLQSENSLEDRIFASKAPEFSLTKSAMIEHHKHEWPSIERDLKGASENGLFKAKAGERDWVESTAMEWARAKNKLIKPAKSNALESGINNMISRPTSSDR